MEVAGTSEQRVGGLVVAQVGDPNGGDEVRIADVDHAALRGRRARVGHRVGRAARDRVADVDRARVEAEQGRSEVCSASPAGAITVSLRAVSVPFCACRPSPEVLVTRLSVSVVGPTAPPRRSLGGDGQAAHHRPRPDLTARLEADPVALHLDVGDLSPAAAARLVDNPDHGRDPWPTPSRAKAWRRGEVDTGRRAGHDDCVDRRRHGDVKRRLGEPGGDDVEPGQAAAVGARVELQRRLERAAARDHWHGRRRGVGLDRQRWTTRAARRSRRTCQPRSAPCSQPGGG